MEKNKIPATCRDKAEGYCGYSQQVVDALTKERDELKAELAAECLGNADLGIVKERDELKNQLNIERIGHRDQIRKLEAELAIKYIGNAENK